MKRVISLFLTLALCFGLSVPVLGAEFTDVPESYIFSQAIQDCVAEGILTGYNDGTFRPGASVTRAQFSVMLARAFFPGEDSSEDFAQWKAAGWYVPSAAVLAGHGAMPYGKTYWSDPAVMGVAITRRDMALFIDGVMKAKGFTVSQEEKDAVQAGIADYDQLGEYYQDAVKSVFALGIITGYAGNTFAGSSAMTRGQAAVVIQRMRRCLSGEPVQPEAPAPAPTTLVNGSAVTEENILAVLEQLRDLFPEGTDFSAGYDLGNTSPVREGTYPYERARDPATHTSNLLGCGGWATLASDAMFGQAGFAMRRTTLAQARPGDIMIMLDGNNRLVHVAMVSGRPSVSGGRTVFPVTEAATDARNVYHIHWDVEYFWKEGDEYHYDIWTRYPG